MNFGHQRRLHVFALRRSLSQMPRLLRPPFGVNTHATAVLEFPGPLSRLATSRLPCQLRHLGVLVQVCQAVCDHKHPPVRAQVQGVLHPLHLKARAAPCPKALTGTHPRQALFDHRRPSVPAQVQGVLLR